MFYPRSYEKKKNYNTHNPKHSIYGHGLGVFYAYEHVVNYAEIFGEKFSNVN